MGGSAFSPELSTPRMPPAIYFHVRDNLNRMLRTLFTHVETPIEAPAKPDYGDVDMLVCEPAVSGGPPVAVEAIGKLLNAKKIKRDKGSEEVHFALPWPVKFESSISTSSGSTQVSKEHPASTVHEAQLSRLSLSDTPSTAPSTTQERYIQLDLHICPTFTTYAWQLFRCAHGDFWTITGSMIRHYGLSFRNSGLYIRIVEVEKFNRKLSLIRLSDDPKAVLEFLFDEGAEGRYWKRDAFEDVEEMCDFIRANCRFYRPLRERELERERSEDEEGPGVEVQKKGKSRLHKRGTFRYWLEEYVPKHSPLDRENGFRGEFAGKNREEVAQMVQERFAVGGEYARKEKVGLRQVGVERLWRDVRAGIPLPEKQTEGEKILEGEKLAEGQNTPIPPPTQPPTLEPNFVLRTLRRKLSIEARELKDQELDPLQLAYREGRFEEVKAWADENWKSVAEEKKSGNEEKSRLHYREMWERRERREREAKEAAVSEGGGQERGEGYAAASVDGAEAETRVAIESQQWARKEANE